MKEEYKREILEICTYTGSEIVTWWVDDLDRHQGIKIQQLPSEIEIPDYEYVRPFVGTLNNLLDEFSDEAYEAVRSEDWSLRGYGDGLFEKAMTGILAMLHEME